MQTFKHEPGPKDPPGRLLAVACLASTGSRDLSDRIGQPVVCIRTTDDVRATIRDLNADRHGSGVRWPASFEPIDFEAGWTDWTVVPLRGPPDNGFPRPTGVVIESGLVVVRLPAATTDQEFDAQLSGALRHLRLQDACIAPRYLDRRNRQSADLVFHPRYTPSRDFRSAGDSLFADCTLCTDFFALDVEEEVWRLFWIVVGARMAACDGRIPSWR